MAGLIDAIRAMRGPAPDAYVKYVDVNVRNDDRRIVCAYHAARAAGGARLVKLATGNVYANDTARVACLETGCKADAVVAKHWERRAARR